MPKIVVTPELASTIKHLRLQQSIASKDVAAQINKSPSYVSRLESGNIRTVEVQTPSEVLGFLSGGDIESEETISKLYDTLTLQFSKDEIEKQIWFANYDTVGRKIPIPDSLIEDILSRMSAHQISRSYLLQRINANEALSESERNDKSIEYNVWYAKGSSGMHSIKMLLSVQILDGILDRKITSAPYVIMQSIVFYILKISKHSDVAEINDFENNELMRASVDLLNSHRFYSIFEKNKLLNSVRSIDEIEQIFSSYEVDNISTIQSIIKKILQAADVDLSTVSGRLKEFDNNLACDVWFMLKIISLKYCDLSSLSTTKKKDFIAETEALIEKFGSMPEDQKAVEIY